MLFSFYSVCCLNMMCNKCMSEISSLRNPPWISNLEVHEALFYLNSSLRFDFQTCEVYLCVELLTVSIYDITTLNI